MQHEETRRAEEFTYIHLHSSTLSLLCSVSHTGRQVTYIDLYLWVSQWPVDTLSILFASIVSNTRSQKIET